MSAVDISEERIFDASVYDLPIPVQDGHRADRLTLSIGGSIELDRTSEDELEFLNGLTLGQEVRLSVTAIVTKKGFAYSVGKDDAADQTGYGVGLKVQAVEAA